jgi:hypothetical protein
MSEQITTIMWFLLISSEMDMTTVVHQNITHFQDQFVNVYCEPDDGLFYIHSDDVRKKLFVVRTSDDKILDKLSLFGDFVCHVRKHESCNTIMLYRIVGSIKKSKRYYENILSNIPCIGFFKIVNDISTSCKECDDCDVCTGLVWIEWDDLDTEPDSQFLIHFEPVYVI